jgi:hypothetical protein
MKNRAFAALEEAGIRAVGPRELLFDRTAAERAIDEIRSAGPIDLLLILQITFTDATMTVKLAKEATTPIAIWAVPEPRSGGRLRLNAYCGLNLAAHALVEPACRTAGCTRRRMRRHVTSLRRSHTGGCGADARRPVHRGPCAAERVLDACWRKITVVGQHPDGFDTCEYDEDLLFKLAGLRVETVPLGQLFDKARAMDAARVGAARAGAAQELEGLDAVDQEQLDRSFRVFCALEDVQRESSAKGLAVRCWPEMFTEYGCAACGPMAMMNQKQVPSACEADVHGSLSQLMLQELAGSLPGWPTSWTSRPPTTGGALHCDLAPISMRDPGRTPRPRFTRSPDAAAAPVPDQPGRVPGPSLPARNETKLMIAGAEVIRADGIHRLLGHRALRPPGSRSRAYDHGGRTRAPFRAGLRRSRRHSRRSRRAGTCPCSSSPEMGAFDVEAPDWGRIPP